MAKGIMLSGQPVSWEEFGDVVGSIVAPQHSANKANLKLAEYQFSKELEMWNKQNAYNTPLAQMERYQAAGLNPNLVAGQGNSGNATQMPQYNAPTMQPSFNPLNLLEVLGKYQDLKMKQAQIDNVKAATEDTKVRTLINAINQKSMQFDYDLKSEFGRQKFLRDFHIQGNEVTKSDTEAAYSLDRWKALRDFDKSPGMMELEKYASELSQSLLREIMLHRSSEMQKIDQLKDEWSWDKMKNMNPKLAGYVQMLKMLKDLVY